MQNTIRHQVPEWEIGATGTTEKDDLQSFGYEDFGVVAADHSVVPVTQTTAAAAGETFPELFEDLSFIHQTDEPTVLRMQEIKPVPGKSKQRQDERPRRSRAAELHNISERKRRCRIKGKMKALQELIPNCNKSDRASMLDDAIEYLKALKLHVHMMSMGGGAMCQASNLSLAGFQGTRIPQFMLYMAMGPGMGMSLPYGMGMINMCYSAGLPIVPVPSAGNLHPLQSATAGLPSLSAPGVLPVPQLQMPFLASQVMPTAATITSIVQPQFATDFSYTFNPAYPGESSSQNNTKTADIQKVPIISKECNVEAIHMVTPPSISDSRVPKTVKLAVSL